MMLYEIVQRLQQIDFLIQIRSTGKPFELAKKVGVSERTIYDDINQLKKLGAPIEFNKLISSYYYTRSGRFKFTFTFDEIRNNLSLNITDNKTNLSIQKN